MKNDQIFTCVIVDDDPSGIDILKEYISYMPNLILIQAYSDPSQAIKEICMFKEKIDFLFLDINMPKVSGMDIAVTVRDQVDKLIFVTAHSEYSLKAYDVLCNQYIMKPFEFDQFATAIKMLIKPDSVYLSNEMNFIFIKANKSKYYKLYLHEIITIDAMEHYVKIHTIDLNNDRYVQHTSMREVEQLLCKNESFLRVHKSHIISTKHIKSIDSSFVIMDNNIRVPIGITFRNAFNKMLEKNSF